MTELEGNKTASEKIGAVASVGGKPRVEGALDENQSAVDLPMAELGELATKLNPILTPATPKEKEDGERTDAPQASDLVHSIERKTACVLEAIEIVKDLTERAEV